MLAYSVKDMLNFMKLLIEKGKKFEYFLYIYIVLVLYLLLAVF